MSNLGYGYYYGDGLKKNMKQAYLYFSKAALLGELDALYMLGDMYMGGYFVEKDEKTAFRIYWDAYTRCKDRLEEFWAKQVYSSACFRIGKCFYEGKGIEQDTIKAEHFLAEAHCYYKLRMQKNDRFAEKGAKNAEEWLVKAINKG